MDKLKEGGIDVILENLTNNPHCPHGPMLLFSKKVVDEKRFFYACAACRDRKQCQFFLWKDEKNNVSPAKREAWEQETHKFLKNINHRNLFVLLNEVKMLPPEKRLYCHTCSRFYLSKYKLKHENHTTATNITDYQLSHPSEMLLPFDNNTKEAQFLFSRKCVIDIVNILKELKIENVICVGTPRIHEYIQSDSNCANMNSLLLDIDDRFHNFFGPLEFCWYNSFNHHFFFTEAKSIFMDFLESKRCRHLALIMDPPFGGRTEPLAHTIQQINQEYQKLNKITDDLPSFWIFPYFMEPQIVNSLPSFKMLDYKVEYDNHTVFQTGPKGRKEGSPVRIFTNVSPSLINLPDDNYKYCQLCERWVAKENRHCHKCNYCTSKDGRTYVHCNICKRCVKPTWKHCSKCSRCTQEQHTCGKLEFTKECFNCREVGHKKSECPKIEKVQVSQKRKRTKSSQKLSSKTKFVKFLK